MWFNYFLGKVRRGGFMMPYRNKTTPYIGIFFWVPLAWSSRQPYMTGQLEIQIQNLRFPASRGRRERRPIVLRTSTINLYLITVCRWRQQTMAHRLDRMFWTILPSSTLTPGRWYTQMNRAPELPQSDISALKSGHQVRVSNRITHSTPNELVVV